MILTAEQLRAARAMLRWEQVTVAEKAGVSVDTVKRLEKMDGPLKANPLTLRAIRRALEFAGVDLGSEGVRPAVDRKVHLITVLASEIYGFVREGLITDVRYDPEFFERGQEHVTGKIAHLLRPRALRAIVERVIPDENRKYSEMEMPPADSDE